MAENLGDALLHLRTDDAQFNAGVDKAEGRAKKLGTELDKTRGQADRLGTEMAETGAKAAKMGDGFQQGGSKVVASSAAQKAGMQQLSYQVGDIATMYSMGARPTQIFASQIGQVTQAIQLATGGASKFAAFLGGPWGMAITAGVIVLAPFIGKLFEAEKAMEAVEFSSHAMGDAQSILGSVIDLTTGKIKDQTSALWALNAAKAAAGQMEARQNVQQLRGSLKDAANEKGGLMTVAGIPVPKLGARGIVGLQRSSTPTAKIAQGVLDGTLSPEAAIKQLQALEGSVPNDKLGQLLSTVANLNVEQLNVKVYEDLEAALNGDKDALEGFLNRPDPKKTRTRTPRTPKGQTAAELQSRFEGEDVQLQRETLQAKLQLATTAEERADIQAELLTLERDQRLAEIEASKLSETQKEALRKRVEELLGKETPDDPDGTIVVGQNTGLQGQLDQRAYAAEIEREIAALAQARFEAETEALQVQLSLADTEAERKAIALKLLEADERYLEQKLQQILDSKVADDNAKAVAQIALDAQRATAAGRREEVARANGTTVDRYLRDLDKTPEQINEVVDSITIGGLETLNDGLVDMLMNARSVGDAFKSMGDLFHSMTEQIIADLLRIAMQQMIVAPIANFIFGAAGAGGERSGGFLSKLLSGFAGLFADGGTIPTGQFGIVGEAGPELAFAAPGGLGIMSNSDSRRALGRGGAEQNGGDQFTFNMPVDATGADSAAIARLNSRLDRMERDLPTTIVGTVRDAQERRFLAGGAA
tara:strand:- start:7359 stop:9650 length:2292 start_codon:yes stop_codon:yes gene_type:complete